MKKSLSRALTALSPLMIFTACSGSAVNEQTHREALEKMLDGLVVKTEPESKACAAFAKEITSVAATDSLKLNPKQIQPTLDLLTKNPGASETKKEIARIVMNEDKNDIKKWGYSGYLLHSGYCNPAAVWTVLQKLIETKKSAAFTKEQSSLTASLGMHLVDDITSYPVRWSHLAIAISVLEDIDRAFQVGKKKSYAAEIKALKKETQDVKNDVILKLKPADQKDRKQIEDAYLEEVSASQGLRKKMRDLYDEISKK